MRFLFLWLFWSVTANAQLAVTVSPPKITGSKAVVPLALKNTSPQKIESARAAVFLVDSQGKVLGQSTKWVIGGSPGTPGLNAGATNAFHFVIGADKPLLSTNLSVRVFFTRLVLEGGKLANPIKDIQITQN
jgi:hypothetical protein